MGFYVFFYKDLLLLRERLSKFLSSALAAPMLYLVAFGLGLGRRLQMEGLSYLDFLVPGIVAITAMTASFSGVAINLNMSRLYTRTFDAYRTSPVHPYSIVLGHALAGIFRGMISSLGVLLVGLLFGAHLGLTMGFLFVLLLSTTLFSAFGVLAALVVNSHEDLSLFNTFVIFPMSFLCGTFFSTSGLPPLLRKAIHLLPLTHSSLLLRGLALGGPVSFLSVLALIGYAVLFLGLSRWAVDRCYR
ncbi:MAG: ABC transporter permease [candidate division NC10 bacterium]|nr:ABC transporter permease [candidate division NC10 bacterium]